VLFDLTFIQMHCMIVDVISDLGRWNEECDTVVKKLNEVLGIEEV